MYARGFGQTLLILTLVNLVKSNQTGNYDQKHQVGTHKMDDVLNTMKNILTALNGTKELKSNSSTSTGSHVFDNISKPTITFHNVPLSKFGTSAFSTTTVKSSPPTGASTMSTRKPTIQSTKFPSNFTSQSTIKLTETTTNKTVSTTEEPIIGSRWDGWMQLLTKLYWKKRFNDKYFLMELLIPVALGVALGWISVTIFFFIRCLIRSNKRKAKNCRADYYNRNEMSDNTWMLLEHNSDDSEEEAV